MRADWQQAAIDRTGSKSGGQCAKGLRLTMQALGIPTVQTPSAYQWNDKLASQGWQKVELPAGLSNAELARIAPPGALLVFDRGRNDAHGHVEMVAIDNSGNRKYISDYAGNKPGGSDINRKLTIWTHPSIQGSDPSLWQSTRGTLASSLQELGQGNGLAGRFGDAADPNAAIAPLLVLSLLATMLGGGQGLNLNKGGPGLGQPPQ